MNIANNLLELANVSIALSVLLWGILQWYLTVRGEKRKRDINLTTWGFEVMEMMAELYSICSQGRPNDAASATAERIAWKASALVEQGRVFFPNVDPTTSHKGFRPKLLDEVVRCCYIARYLSEHSSPAETKNLRDQVKDARKAFRIQLQKKIHLTLLHVDEADIGERIPGDPTTWPPRDVPPSILS